MHKWLGWDEVKVDWIFNCLAQKDEDNILCIDQSKLIASTVIIEDKIDKWAHDLFKQIDCEDGGTIDAEEFQN